MDLGMRAPAQPYPMPRIEVSHGQQSERGPEPRVPRVSPSPPPPPRLVSLDVFRGLVILAMLLVNNLGDTATTGYFWKHADWPAMSQRHAWAAWWGYAAGLPSWAERLKQ